MAIYFKSFSILPVFIHGFCFSVLFVKLIYLRMAQIKCKENKHKYRQNKILLAARKSRNKAECMVVCNQMLFCRVAKWTGQQPRINKSRFETFERRNRSDKLNDLRLNVTILAPLFFSHHLIIIGSV